MRMGREGHEGHESYEGHGCRAPRGSVTVHSVTAHPLPAAYAVAGRQPRGRAAPTASPTWPTGSTCTPATDRSS